MKKGLLVELMGTDCTNGGVTSGKRDAVLIGDGIPEIFEPTDDAPALDLHVDFNIRLAPGRQVVARTGWLREIGFAEHKLVRKGPMVLRVSVRPLGKTGGMFGGHWITSSDSRFPFDSPIPVHDRFES